MKITHTALFIPAFTLAFVGAGAAAGYAGLVQADTTDTSGTQKTQQMHRGGFSGGVNAQDGDYVHGTVTAVSGTTVTVTDVQSSTSYTIDTSNATIIKASEGERPTGATIADIAVGDTIGAHGTLSGTTLVADRVTDGMGMGGPRDGSMMERGGRGGMGTVTAVSGSSITLTTQNGETMTVDASSASVSKMVTGSLADVAVGDTISVQGTRGDGTIKADHIMTGMQAPSQQ